MSNSIAVIDLGTNTFHLLIVEGTASHYNTILHIEEAVKLGEGGINKGMIQPEAFERGLNAMQRFNQHILKHNVKQIRAIATSALRNAANGRNFINRIKTDTGISIEIIDGRAEATFIYKGVKASGCLLNKNSLIVDIGGGSCEFIICDDEQIKWKQSFEIGAARLMDRFHTTDPIGQESVRALNLYLEDNLKDLFTAVTHYSIKNIIGSSGVFESYAVLIEQYKGINIDLKKTKCYAFNNDQLLAITENIVLSSHQERLVNKGIIPVRVDMIVVASIIIRFIMQTLNYDNIIMSMNSLKEGVLIEMMS